MPEPRRGRGVRVVDRNRAALGRGREAGPGQVWGKVLAGHTPAVEHLGIGHLLAVGEICAGHVEAGHLRKEVVWVRRAVVSHDQPPTVWRCALPQLPDQTRCRTVLVPSWREERCRTRPTIAPHDPRFGLFGAIRHRMSWPRWSRCSRPGPPRRWPPGPDPIRSGRPGRTEPGTCGPRSHTAPGRGGPAPGHTDQCPPRCPG